MDPSKPSSLEPSAQHGITHELESVRSILFAQEQARIEALEERAAILSQTDQEQSEQVKNRVQALQTEIDDLQQTAQAHKAQADALLARLDQLRTDITAESETLIPHLTDQMSGMISATIHDSRDEMAEALGPVMGEAIRVQIRDSREDMVEALYPIILSAVQRAIAEFAREFQRNIDARLKSTFGPQGVLRTISARLRGVSSSELVFRDALPFAIQELFLIQHESGLLMTHLSHKEDADEASADEASADEASVNDDSDLISGMLTAIRDFAHDSIGDGSEDESLDEIQYGDERIIIQSGQHIYLAVVTTGVEPEWFRARMRAFVSELHIQHAPALRDYTGDPAMLPDLPPMLAQLSADLIAPRKTESKGMSRGQKLALAGSGLLGLLLIAAACFYLQFTIALWPLAFGTPTATMIALPTETAVPLPTNTAIPASTQTQTPIPTATYTPQPTNTAPFTATPSATNTQTPAPSPTATAPPITTNVPVWTRGVPNPEADTGPAIPANTPITILTRQGEWIEVEWLENNSLQRGWIQVQWTTLEEPSNN